MSFQLKQTGDQWSEFAKWALFIGSIASSIALGFELWNIYRQKQ